MSSTGYNEPRLPRWSRRRLLAAGAAGLLFATGARRSGIAQAPPTDEVIDGIVQEAIATCDLRSVLLHLDIGGETIASQAWGISADGETATPEMTFRTGEMTLAQLSTLALLLQDDGVLSLDAPVASWLPDLPDAESVSCRSLANMTAGYRDYTQDPGFWDTCWSDPTRHFTDDELLDIGLNLPRAFSPGASWEFSHTNMIVLGKVLAAVGGQPLADLLRDRVLDPAELTTTAASIAPEDPAPTLRAWSSERRRWADVAADAPFIEESTGWDTSWAMPEGARQVSTVADLARGIGAIARGDLITPEARLELIQPAMTPSGGPEYDCTCTGFDSRAAYGLGVNLSGDWMVQSSNVAGYGTAMAWYSSVQIAVGLAVTYGKRSFDGHGQFKFGNVSERILLKLAETLVPQSMA